MKNILLTFTICILSCGFIHSQVIYKPPMSPEAAFTQEFGENEIQVQYARPSARGRKIFGGLVPFDTLWRTGAKDCTTFYVNGTIEFAGQKLDSGKYSLFSIPGEKEWIIILNKDFDMHGSSLYTQDKDILRIRTVPQHTTEYCETFTINITDFDISGSAKLVLAWENTKVNIQLIHPLYKMLSNSNTDTSKNKIVISEAINNENKSPLPEKEKSPVSSSLPPTVNKESNANSHAGHTMSSQSNKDISDLSSQFKLVLEGYYSLKDALVTDNPGMASDKAKSLEKALAEISTTGWSTDQASVYSKPMQNKLNKDVVLIKDNGQKIDIQRKHFITLSENITKLVKELKLNVAPAYLQFCPMANGGKGAYWLSKENKVLNPYYGKQMLTCGSVKEIYN